MKTAETIKINSELKIVKFSGQKFKAPGGYYLPNGFSLYHPELGFFAFEGKDHPYQPVGGRKALKRILETGGFTDFDTAVWLQPMN